MRQYADFSGRARRTEYWMFILFQIIFALAAMVIDYVIGTNFEPLPYGVFYLLYALATFIPGLAVAVRRLHDTGKSGWYYLVVLIPLAGPIWLLVLMCLDGDRGPNEYGPDPKNVTEIDEIGTTYH